MVKSDAARRPHERWNEKRTYNVLGAWRCLCLRPWQASDDQLYMCVGYARTHSEVRIIPSGPDYHKLSLERKWRRMQEGNSTLNAAVKNFDGEASDCTLTEPAIF